MACEEKPEVPENPQKTSPEDTQQVVSEEPQQTPSEPSAETPFKESEEAPAEEEGCKIKKTILTLLLCAFVFLTGCATITTGKYQNISVTSEPPGVKVRSCTGVSLTTPGSFELARNHNYTLVAEYPGCEPQQKELKHKLQGCFWRNILICGIISGVVDLASGACYELRPEKVHFDFTSAGQAVASRQRSYLESHSETAEEVRFAILNELAKKGMTKEELMANLGKPDLINQEGESEVFVYNNRKLQRYYLKNGILKETHTSTWVGLSWTPGDFAVSHDVYFGDNFADVNAGTGEAFRGNQAATNLIVGMPRFLYPAGLVPETTYYRRIEVAW